jgi:hypothetical protein
MTYYRKMTMHYVRVPGAPTIGVEFECRYCNAMFLPDEADNHTEEECDANQLARV